MSNLPPLPSKPHLLPHTLAEYIRLARFAQDIRHCRVLLQPKRRKPPVIISPQPSDLFDDEEPD